MLKFVRVILCVLFVSFGIFADNAQFGLNTHNFPCEHPAGSPVRTLFEQLNVKWIRAGIDWWQIEQTQGVYTFTEVDKIVNYAHDHDVNVLLVLAYNPAFYGSSNHNCLNPDYIDNWKAFITAMVNRYKSKVKHWELWNEPNLLTFWNTGTVTMRAQCFVDWILIPGVEAIRAADPQAKICGPDLSNIGDWEGWFNYITNRVGVVFDVLTHHAYDDTPTKSFNQLSDFYNNAVNKGYGGKEFWITEIGWIVSPEGMQNMQEIFNLMLAHSSWWKKTFWYAWRASDGYLIDPQTGVPNALYTIFKGYSNPAHITVISPNGGESWSQGVTYAIQWHSSWVTDVKIELVKGTTVNTVITSSTPADDGSYTTYTWTVPADQAVGSNYKIRISGEYYGDTYTDSSNANFSVICNTVPDKPALSSPADNVTLNTLTPTFKWVAVEACPVVDYYQVQVNLDGTKLFASGNLTGTSYTVPSGKLSFGKTYRWYVRAHNSAGWGSWNGRNLTLVNGAKPTAPVLVSPANNAEDVALRPILKWNAVTATPAVDYYQVQINLDGSQIYLSGNVTATSFQVPAGVLDYDTTYQWFVRAHNTLGFSGWSGRTFTTRLPKPDPPGHDM